MSLEDSLNTDPEEGNEVNQQPSELDLLKERATLMGIQFHPNIGLDKLKAKVTEKLEGTKPEEEKTKGGLVQDELETIEEANWADKAVRATPLEQMTPEQRKAKRRQDALRLVRVRIVNMNPIKNNLKGEIVSAGNAQIGFVKKFVPFNAEQGWHVPNILLTSLRNRKYMTHYEVKVGNKKIKKNKLVPEFSIEVLPPLTEKELELLKQRQIMAAGQ